MKLEYVGDIELLNCTKTAFLASSTIPPDMVLRSYDWAQQMGRNGQCVISGFSSHLEKNVLHFLLKGKGPIVLVLARSLYKSVPAELQPLIDNGRLLIVSVSSASRQSRTTALARNRYICEVADSIFMVGATESSSLFALREEFGKKILGWETM